MNAEPPIFGENGSFFNRVIMHPQIERPQQGKQSFTGKQWLALLVYETILYATIPIFVWLVAF